ncbi:MAG: hypothetical protein AB1589_15440 [Cyanobacteriota bacterium]
MYERHIDQLRRDFSLALALAEQRDRLNADTDKLSELQRLASLVEDMRGEIRGAQERIKEARYDRDLINAFEKGIGQKVKIVELH